MLPTRQTLHVVVSQSVPCAKRRGLLSVRIVEALLKNLVYSPMLFCAVYLRVDSLRYKRNQLRSRPDSGLEGLAGAVGAVPVQVLRVARTHRTGYLGFVRQVVWGSGSKGWPQADGNTTSAARSAVFEPAGPVRDDAVAGAMVAEVGVAGEAVLG